MLGRAIAGAAARIWQRVGEADALDLVQDANERESHVLIRWVWLDGAADAAHAPDVPVNMLGQVTLGEPAALRWQNGDDDEALYTYIPADVPGARQGAIELRESLEIERSYVRRTIMQATVTTATLVLLCAVIALGLGAVFVGRPVRRLVEQARRVGGGDLSSRLELHQRDEIGELAVEMNGMSERLAVARTRIATETAAKLAAIEQVRHADRLMTVGKLASGIAHEVGTPLNVITGHAQLITDDYPEGTPAHANALVVAEQAHRVANIIRQLLDFARPRRPHRVGQDVVPIVTQVASLLDALAQKRDIALHVEAAETPLRALVDAPQLQQVVTNLVVNALHATPVGGAVTIGVELAEVVPPADVDLAPGEYVRAFVRDAGTGIAADVLPRIFEPFFTTKDTGQGTGLGLSVAYGMVREHGGWIGVQTELGRGSCFSVYLPQEKTT